MRRCNHEGSARRYDHEGSVCCDHEGSMRCYDHEGSMMTDSLPHSVLTKVAKPDREPHGVKSATTTVRAGKMLRP